MYIFASNGSGIYNTSIKVIIQICIETIIRQRGIGNHNPVKLDKCIKELERIYDIHQGNGSNQYEQNPKLSDKANMQGTSRTTPYARFIQPSPASNMTHPFEQKEKLFTFANEPFQSD